MRRGGEPAILLLAAIVGCAAGSAGHGAPSQRPGDSRQASRADTVFVLGSLHGFMLEHPHYSLRAFIGALEEFHPDIILTEVRPDHPGPSEGSIDGGVEQSLVYAYGRVRHVEIHPVDWFDDDLVAKLQKEGSDDSADAIGARVKQLDAMYSNIIESGTFAQIESRSTATLVRQIYELDEQRGHVGSRIRNERICRNIAEALGSASGARVMVVFGLDHKYFLDDCIARRGDHVLDVADWLEASRLDGAVVDPAIKAVGLQNIAGARALLRHQLAAGVYNGSWKAKMEKKEQSFDRWLAAVEKL